MRITKESLNLECKLTDAEKLQYSRDIAEAIKRRAGAEDSLKSIQQQKKAEIAEADEKINRLASYINAGFEYRFIECKVVYDFKKKERSWIRKDNNETAKTDIIPEEDLQEEMRLKNPKAKKGADKKTEKAADGKIAEAFKEAKKKTGKKKPAAAKASENALIPGSEWPENTNAAGPNE